MPVIMTMSMPMPMAMAMTNDDADVDTDNYYDDDYDHDADESDDCGVDNFIYSAQGFTMYNRMYCNAATHQAMPTLGNSYCTIVAIEGLRDI